MLLKRGKVSCYCYSFPVVFVLEYTFGLLLTKRMVSASWFVFYQIFGLVSAQGAVPLPFVQRDKRKQKHAFSHRAESTHNHRQGLYKLIFILLFLLTFSAVFKSVLIGDYEVSALCFSGALFRTSLFKTALFYCDRYFLLLPHFVHFALLSAPIYSLLAPVVAIGCFSRF